MKDLRKELPVGSLIRTSYGIGVYSVIDVSGPCHCSHYVDYLESIERRPDFWPHYHIECKGQYVFGRYRMNDRGDIYSPFYPPNKNKSWSKATVDQIFIVEAKKPAIYIPKIESQRMELAL